MKVTKSVGLSEEISNFHRHPCDVVMQLHLHIKWHDSRTPDVNYETVVISSQNSQNLVTSETDDLIQWFHYLCQNRLSISVWCLTRNTFCGKWYLPHSHVHNERNVPIIMAGCMVHEREGYISTSGPKSDVTIVFLDPISFRTREFRRFGHK